ncbi:hypothetical protein Tco_0905217 [Tanacetum coccineum]
MSHEELEYTKTNIPQISREKYIPRHLKPIIRNLETRTIHEGRTIPQGFIQYSNFKTKLSNVHLQCLYDVDEDIHPRFLLELFSSIKFLINEDNSIYLYFWALNRQFNFPLELLAHILQTPLLGDCVKAPRTDFIDLSSNESSSIQNIPINTTLDTTLALIIPPPTISQTIPSQETKVSTLVPRALIFSTPPSSSPEPHPYLTTLDDLPPRNSNPPSPLLSQGHSQGLSQILPIPTPMDFEASFPPINLSRSRICAQPEPSLSTDKSKITRKQLKTGKHGHENQKCTKPKPEKPLP